MRAETRCVHHPAVNDSGYVPLTVATHRASTTPHKDMVSFATQKFVGFDGYTHGLNGTPTTRTLKAQITELPAGVRTVLVPSGQATASIVMTSVLRSGDRILIPDNVNPSVRTLCSRYLAARGIGYGVYDPAIGDQGLG